MANITTRAAAKFKQIFEKIGYDKVAIKLGVRPVEPDSTEHYIDFIPDNHLNLLSDVVFLTNGVMIVSRREDEHLFEKTVIDYIEDPEGFIFEIDKE